MFATSDRPASRMRLQGPYLHYSGRDRGIGYVPIPIASYRTLMVSQTTYEGAVTPKRKDSVSTTPNRPANQ